MGRINEGTYRIDSSARRNISIVSWLFSLPSCLDISQSSPERLKNRSSSTIRIQRPVGAPDFEFSQLDMPALSSTMKEGKVVSWLKSEGDAVGAGEAIMVVESDKADMDVEAFEDGFIAAIITGEGEAAAVGSPVALIAANEADIPALKAYAAVLAGGGGGVVAPAPVAAAAASAAPVAAKAPPKAAVAASAASTGGRVVASPLAKTMAAEMGIDISTVVGTGPDGRITAGDVQKAALSPASAKAPSKGAAAAAPKVPSWTPAAGVIAATPTARALAKKAKLDLSTIVGTGEFGRVTADDVKMATGEMKPKKKSVAPGAPAPVELPEGLVPFTGMQRAVSNNMEKTLDCPVFRASREIEMDAFNDLYQQVKPKGVTVSALLAKAVAKALEKHPIVNSSYRKEGTFFNKDINIAMAVAIDGGLITPVLKNANERGVLDLGEDWKVRTNAAPFFPFSCSKTTRYLPHIGNAIFILPYSDHRDSSIRRRRELSSPTSITRAHSRSRIWACSAFPNSTPSSPVDRAASSQWRERRNTSSRASKLCLV